MRFFSFVFLFIFSLNIAAQSPTVSNLFAEGTKHAAAARFDDALKSYKTALFAAENEYLGAGYRSRLHYNIGVCYFRTERFDMAANHFRSAILLKKDYTRAHYALGMAKLRERDWKVAAATFEQVLKLQPGNGEAWFDLAFANVALRNFETAAEAFGKSIEFGSVDSALSHNNIGVILAVKGDLAVAERAFETALAMSGGALTEAKRNLEFCRSARTGNPKFIATDLQYAGRELGLVG